MGDPLLASDGWTGRAQIRTSHGGELIATFGASGDGTVTFDDAGNVTLELPSLFTETLDGYTSRSGYVGDLEVWKASTPDEKWRALDFRVRIYDEVTTS